MQVKNKTAETYLMTYSGEENCEMGFTSQQPDGKLWIFKIPANLKHQINGQNLIKKPFQKSKAQMTALHSENKSKHTRGSNVHTFWLDKTMQFLRRLTASVVTDN